MIINGHVLRFNEHLPSEIKSELRTKVAGLAGKVGALVGPNYNVKVEFSDVSEAAYMTFVNLETGEDMVVSFRNHKSTLRAFDVELRLTQYDSWRELERIFINVNLPSIISVISDGKEHILLTGRENKTEGVVENGV